jgi:hypothetical protein
MTVFAMVLHLAGFLAPAFVTGFLLWLAAGGWRSGRRGRMALGGVWLAGTLVLVGGLVWFGRDGKIVTYAALVLAQGTVVWWWRGR